MRDDLSAMDAALTAALAYAFLRFLSSLVRLVSETGIRASSRLVAVLIAAVAVKKIRPALRPGV